jgi:hypothetical protein
MKSDGSTAEYYELPEGAQELQDLISAKDMNGQIAEIFRTCYRYGTADHSDRLRDAKKIRFYADAEVERLERYGIRVATRPEPPEQLNIVFDSLTEEEEDELLAADLLRNVDAERVKGEYSLTPERFAKIAEAWERAFGSRTRGS